jgi:uncharacterized protein YjbI with pentapeptide repeats
MLTRAMLTRAMLTRAVLTRAVLTRAMLSFAALRPAPPAHMHTSADASLHERACTLTFTSHDAAIHDMHAEYSGIFDLR